MQQSMATQLRLCAARPSTSACRPDARKGSRPAPSCTHLTLRLPDRRDLIAFKLFAAVDAAHGRQPVHKSDLRALAPNEEELREFLQELGHEDLAYYIA